MMVYLDNAATTIPSAKVLESVNEFYFKFYENPSSLHESGYLVSKEISEIKKQIVNFLGVVKEEIYFTSGGTESNNLVIFGINHKNKNIVYSENQHSSIVEPIEKLKYDGFETRKVEISDGNINIDDLLNKIDKNTSLVCLTHVNNETGTIEDIQKIGKLIKSKNPKTIFHVDCVQSFGKIKINTNNINTLSFNSHKIHGLKGLGGLLVRREVNLKPLFYGGNQQNKLRPGTENTTGIFAMGIACKEQFENIQNNYNYVNKLKEKFLLITKKIPDVYINGNFENASPYILNLSFKGIKGEVLLNALSEKKIFVSTGSACLGGKESKNLLASGISKEKVSSAIRFSFSHYNTETEIDYCLKVLQSEIEKLRA